MIFLIRDSSKKANSMVEVATRIPRLVNPTLELTHLVSSMVKENISRRTKKDIEVPSATENVMVKEPGKRILLTLTLSSIVANGNTTSSTALVVLNGAINVLTTRVNFTWVLNMVVDHSISEKNKCSTRVSFKTT